MEMMLDLNDEEMMGINPERILFRIVMHFIPGILCWLSFKVQRAKTMTKTQRNNILKNNLIYR